MREIRTVGLVGCGRMGLAIAGHITAGGWPVVATDPDPAAQQRARDAGAEVLESAAAVGAVADLTLVVVVDDAQVLSAGREALAAMRPDSVLAICSSVRPETCKELARKAAAKGVETIDVALVRGERGAEEAGLALFCGGDAGALEACRAVFSSFATDVCHLGEVGMGQVAKTANNILLWACLRANTEALRLASAMGLAPSRLRPALAIGSGANRPLAEWGKHRLRWPGKDLEGALSLAAGAGVEVPFVECLATLMDDLTVEDLQALR